MTDCTKEYKKAADSFRLLGEVTDIRPYGEGHINLTLLVTTTEKRYILQKMNTRVFPDPDSLMKNICGVTEHLRSRGIETLNVVPTKSGAPFLKNEECFRVYEFIENTVTYQQVTDKKVFFNSGKAFGASLVFFTFLSMSLTVSPFSIILNAALYCFSTSSIAIRSTMAL